MYIYIQLRERTLINFEMEIVFNYKVEILPVTQ